MFSSQQKSGSSKQPNGHLVVSFEKICFEISQTDNNPYFHKVMKMIVR